MVYIWSLMGVERRGVHVRYINMIMDIYHRVGIIMRTAGGSVDELPIWISLTIVMGGYT